MKPKSEKILYWVITVIFSLAILQSAVVEIMQTESSKQLMDMLGYPHYLNTILGVAKILGVIAIIQPWFKTIKEWAYAGFSIDFIGAMASGMYATDEIAIIIVPLIFLVVMFLSYYFWKKTEQIKTDKF